MDSQPVLIIVDWGSTNLRLYLVNKRQKIIEKKDSSAGILNAKGELIETLLAHVEPWINEYGRLPVIMSGMIGSRSGLYEVPYVSCPTNAKKIAANLQCVTLSDQFDSWIVPGLVGKSLSHNSDVMRGEETQAIGALEEIKANSSYKPSLICFPGTHNKWTSVTEKQIISFSTTMTGELFSVLGKYSLLTNSVDERVPFDQEAFETGLAQSKKCGGILHHLFTVRTNNLLGQHDIKQGTSYLSGILIGNELQSMQISDYNQVTVVGSKALVERYLTALSFFGISASSIDGDKAIVAGAFTLAFLAKIINKVL